MNKKLLNILNIFAKNAVNALIVNVTAWWILPANFNLHNTAAEWNIAKLAGGVILSRELLVWGPVVLKWSQTGANPSDLQESLDVAADASEKASEAIQDAKSAAPKQ